MAGHEHAASDETRTSFAKNFQQNLFDIHLLIVSVVGVPDSLAVIDSDMKFRPS